jgi:hypothetical protein
LGDAATQTQHGNDEAEQRRRREINQDTRVSIALGIGIDQVVKRREQAEVEWMGWLNVKMAEQRAYTPQEIMPSICARLGERGCSGESGQMAQAHQWRALGLETRARGDE